MVVVVALVGWVSLCLHLFSHQVSTRLQRGEGTALAEEGDIGLAGEGDIDLVVGEEGNRNLVGEEGSRSLGEGG